MKIIKIKLFNYMNKFNNQNKQIKIKYNNCKRKFNY